ncbi:MAG: EAL domain-containing protein [Acidobacteriota bacterium]
MTVETGPGAPARILVVDDDEAIRRILKRILESAGFSVDVAGDGAEALGLVASGSYDAIFSDISMPAMDGLAMLRAIRRYDLDVPVVLITGAPAMQTAMLAIEYGAAGYLEKPIEPAKLRETAQHSVRMHALAKLKRRALELHGKEGLYGDRASAETRLERAMERMWIAYQPIVSWKDRRVFGYEALLRSDEPSLATPIELFRVAERIDRVGDVGHAIRLRVADEITRLDPGALLFLNIHPKDLDDPKFVERMRPLLPWAARIVLEITERAALDEVKLLHDTIRALRAHGFRLAIDDLGAGYAGLTSLAMVEPEVVKLDLSLIRDVGDVPMKGQIVRSMIGLCAELGMMVVAEGVETAGERDAIVEMGGDLLQGFLFAKPGRPFPEPSFSPKGP